MATTETDYCQKQNPVFGNNIMCQKVCQNDMEYYVQNPRRCTTHIQNWHFNSPSFCLDSIYLFKGDRYWKFLFPGSSPEPGYPRPMSTDWLDCPDSSSTAPGDTSLSPHPVGRQGVQERWREERVGHVAEGEEKDKENRNRIKDGDRERSRPQLRACICSTAPATRTAPISMALLLGTWILSTCNEGH